MKYKPVLSLEELLPDDGLEVTKAINESNPSNSSNSQELVKIVDKSNETNDEDEDGQTTDENSLDSQDAESEEDSKNLSGAVDAAQALECIACELEKNSELTPEQKQTIAKISNSYAINDPISLESFDSAMKSVGAAIVKIWDYILGLLGKISDTIKAKISAFMSRATDFDEDVENIKKSLSNIDRGSSKNTEMPIKSYHLLLTGDDAANGATVIKNVGKIKTVLTSYFDHIKHNFDPYLGSIKNLYDLKLNNEGTLEELSYDDGTVGLEGTLQIQLSSSTKPGFLTPVLTLPRHKPPFTGAKAFKSQILPGAHVMAAWLTDDSTITTKHDTDILLCKMFYYLDYDNVCEKEKISVLTKSEMKNLLAVVETMITAMAGFESTANKIISGIAALTTLAKNLKKEAQALERLNVHSNMKTVAAYKKRVALLMLKLIELTQQFYIKPTQDTMFYGNRSIKAALALITDSAKEYV